MKKEEIVNKVNDMLLKIAFVQNNIQMTADVFDSVKSRKSVSLEEMEVKLYDLDRIGNRMETTFNYIDSELEYLFEELNECLKLVG